MQDGIIKGTGDSRYLKTVADAQAKYPTYEAFIAALAAGTFPVDFYGVNEAGWYQLNTALNKENLLKEATAALYGLGADAVPDTALAAIRELIDEAMADRRVLVKAAELILTAPANQMDLDLSGVDWEQYAGAWLSFNCTSDAPSSTVGEVLIYANGITSGYGDDGSLGYLARAPLGFDGGAVDISGALGLRPGITLNYTAVYAGSAVQAFTASGVLSTRVAALTKLTAKEGYNYNLLPGSRMTVYGIRK